MKSILKIAPRIVKLKPEIKAGRGAEVLIVGEYTAKAKMGRDKDGKVVKEVGGRPAPSFLL